MTSFPWVLGGDFNCWLDPVLNRSSNKISSPSKAASFIKTYIDELAISDPWRFKNPHSKVFSFFSPVHHTFSRIDYFLTDNRLLLLVQNCAYNTIIISDHAPVTMGLLFETGDKSRLTWRLNARFLADDQFVKFITAQIDDFISLNKTQDIATATLWETLKAYIRGQIISYASNERKSTQKRQLELSHRISQIDNIFADTPEPALYKERLYLQAEFNTLSSKSIEDLLMKSKTQQYQYGNKTGKLLAHQLRQSSASHQILKIQTPQGVTAEPLKTNEQFHESLYSSEQISDPYAFDTFFDPLDIPTVNVDSFPALNSPITIQGLNQAAYTMQTSKSPGPVGYPVEFFKRFLDKLGPLLIDTYSKAFDFLRLPLTLTQATISLILKKDKDPLQCGSFRPISLLNVDYKLLAKILAKRLETIYHITRSNRFY